MQDIVQVIDEWIVAHDARIAAVPVASADQFAAMRDELFASYGEDAVRKAIDHHFHILESDAGNTYIWHKLIDEERTAARQRKHERTF